MFIQTQMDLCGSVLTVNRRSFNACLFTAELIIEVSESFACVTRFYILRHSQTYLNPSDDSVLIQKVEY